MSGSQSKLKYSILGQTADSLDKYLSYSEDLMSSLQQSSFSYTLGKVPRVTSLEQKRQFAVLEEQSDGQGGEEREIKSPVTKRKVQEKRVFLERRMVRERREFSLW